MKHLIELASATGSGDTVYTVLLAALNVVQTVALAYLAARAHVDHPPRRRRESSRRDVDASPPPAT